MDSGAVRDILYSRVSIAPGISDHADRAFKTERGVGSSSEWGCTKSSDRCRIVEQVLTTGNILTFHVSCIASGAGFFRQRKDSCG